MSKNEGLAPGAGVRDGAEEGDFLALRREIEARVSAGAFDWAGDLAVAAAARTAAGRDSRGRYEMTLVYVLDALTAHPGPESLRTVLRVAAVPHVDGGPVRTRRERGLASLVARGQRIEDIVRAVFAGGAEPVPSREFSACLLHELVLVSDRVGEYPALLAIAGTLEAEGHPLAALPLSLLSEENGLRRPDGAAADWTWTVPPPPFASFEAPALCATPAMRRRVAGIDMTETSLPELAATMGAAVRHWRAESNGQIAAQEFWSPDPVPADDCPAVFELLPLIPWTGDDAPARLYASTADEVLRILLTAAVRPPAYGAGLGGAYGRLAAWRSLGALAGAPADAPITSTAELVRQTRWFRVGAGSSRWFHDIAWDLAVAALRPGGRDIAVLAATDTD